MDRIDITEVTDFLQNGILTPPIVCPGHGMTCQIQLRGLGHCQSPLNFQIERTFSTLVDAAAVREFAKMGQRI